MEDVDAVLWLRDCIKTGDQNLIESALATFKTVATPAKELETRYCHYLVAKAGGNTMAALFGGFGFADLEGLAKKVIEDLSRKSEAMGRFGTEKALFAPQPAEVAIKAALRRLKRDEDWNQYDPVQAAARFEQSGGAILPHTLSDCMHGMDYWRTLNWRLRGVMDQYWDGGPYESAHSRYCFNRMQHIAPRSKEEALAAFEYIQEHEHVDADVVRNLISGGWV